MGQSNFQCKLTVFGGFDFMLYDKTTSFLSSSLSFFVFFRHQNSISAWVVNIWPVYSVTAFVIANTTNMNR